MKTKDTQPDHTSDDEIERDGELYLRGVGHGMRMKEQMLESDRHDVPPKPSAELLFQPKVITNKSQDAQSESSDPNEIPMAKLDRDYAAEEKLCPKCGGYWMRMIPEKSGPLWACSCGYEERWSQDARGDEGKIRTEYAAERRADIEAQKARDARGEGEFVSELRDKQFIDRFSVGDVVCPFCHDLAKRLQKQSAETARPSVTREEWKEVSGYINRGEWTGVDLLVWLAEKGVEVKDA